ncbi:MAG: glycoside hydrolase family 5 protein, partial [Cytophagaceae bacterium]|nr:glycoside hydrolase family 5 protein [Cytophagaceae bacterium]
MHRIYFLISILTAFSNAAFSVTTVSVPAFSKATYAQYEKAQATFTISFNGGNYTNPFDPAIAQVDAQITLPNATVITVPCFYYYPANYTVSSPTWWDATENPGAATWMLRYAPTMLGNHTVRIRVIDANGTLNSGNTNINVIAGTKKGFVRLNPAKDQFAKFDNGTAYYPIGVNLAWNDGRLMGNYNPYLANLGTNKATWIRYWLTDFARQALECRNTHWSGWYGGLGTYSQRAAGLLDSVLNECERRDIYMQLVLQHHGQVSTTTNAQWADNPYNSANGGPCANAGQFFTNVAAKAQLKKQYRYIVARWGYSSNVLAWELFNEVEFTDGTDADIDAWHDEMSAYIKSIDVNNHLITSSSGGDNSTLPLLDNNASLDFTQYHIYAGSPIEKNALSESQTLKAAQNKPIWCGEFGLSGNYPAAAAGDNWADHVRKTMWIGMMSEVPAMFWYWDTYIQNYNLYNVFRPLGVYLTGVDIAGETGGNYNAFNFANNPNIVGTVTASPGNNNWGYTNIPNPWSSTVTGDGDVAGLNNLCRYLHGSFQGTRSREATFTVTFQSAGSAICNLATSSGGGTNTLQIYVDGVLRNTWNIPNNTGGTFTTTTGLTAGTHTIRFLSSGQDWLDVNNFQFTNVQLKQLKGYGYVGGTKAYGYVYDQSLPQWIDPASVTAVTTAQIKIGSLTPGSYKVDFFDPQAGSAFVAGGTYTTVNDTITVPIPSFKKDIAFKVYPSSLPVESGDFEGKLM